jgi:macrolide-specific efflux system membrane fusion protein
MKLPLVSLLKTASAAHRRSALRQTILPVAGRFIPNAWNAVNRDAKSRKRWIIIAGAVILVAGASLLLLRGKKKDVEPEFYDYTVARGDIKLKVSAAGDVTPQNRIELKPPLSGRIETILVREGDYIKKGQILAWISSTDRASLLDAARAKGEAEAAKWEDVYKPTPLVAPLAGFIIVRKAEPGQSIGSGDAPLVMADRLIVRAQVDETDMGKIKVGQRCEVSLDAYPEIRLPGRLDKLAFESRQINNVTVYDIEVELMKSSSVLRSGMTATADVIINDRSNVIVIPAEALKDAPMAAAAPGSAAPGKPAETKGGKNVPGSKDKAQWGKDAEAKSGGNGWGAKAPETAAPAADLVVTRKGKNGKLETVPVTIGVTDGERVEVTKGLKDGDVLQVPTSGMGASTLSNNKSPLMPNLGGRRH